jgi:hypothetical protein
MAALFAYIFSPMPPAGVIVQVFVVRQVDFVIIQ